MIRSGRAASSFSLIALAFRLSHNGAEWALGLSGLGLPIQTVLFARVAGELLRVLQESIFIPILHRVFSLGIDDREQGLNREQLILADPAVENFLLAFLRVKNPARAFFHQRDRKRPIVLADHQNEVVAFLNELVLFIVGLNKFFASTRVSYLVSRKDQFL